MTRVMDGLVLCRRRRISGARDLAEQPAGDQAAVEKRAGSMLDIVRTVTALFRPADNRGGSHVTQSA